MIYTDSGGHALFDLKKFGLIIPEYFSSGGHPRFGVAIFRYEQRHIKINVSVYKDMVFVHFESDHSFHRFHIKYTDKDITCVLTILKLSTEIKSSPIEEFPLLCIENPIVFDLLPSTYLLLDMGIKLHG